MNFAVYTSFYKDRAEKGIEFAAERAASLGLEGVEYFGRVPSELWRDAERERQILSKNGLRVVCYSVLAQLFCEDQEAFWEQMKREIEAAATLGSPYFHHTVFPHYSMRNVQNSYEEVFSKIVDLAERIAKECNRRGMTCLYEPQGVYFNGIDGLERLLFEMKRRGCEVGICGDFGNSLFVDVDPVEIFRRFGTEIRHVHVKDYRLSDHQETNQRSYESLSGRLIYETKLGTGAVNFAEGFRLLKQYGYDGAVSLEFDGDDQELGTSLKTTKKFCETNRSQEEEI